MRKKLIIAIDLGGTNLKIAVVNLRYKIIDREVLSTKRFEKKEDLISGICHSVGRIIENNKFKKTDVLGVGLGLPGPVDYGRGIVHYFPNIAGWKEVGLKKILRERLGLAVFLDNDAKLMSLAEHRLGNARGFENALCITLGTGVGGGIIISGKLYRGPDNAAGEIGHLPLNEKGPRCNCGGNACLEAYVGNNRITEQAKKAFKRNVSLEELSLLAKHKNKHALRIWRKVGERLGAALIAAVNLLNLDAVIIGGGVANAGAELFNTLRKKIMSQAMSVQAGRVKLYKAKFGIDAGLIGAAILVKEGIGE